MTIHMDLNWLTIIIPCRGEPDLLWFTLQSLLFEDLRGVEILVVDNSPEALKKGDCADVAQAFGKPVHYRVGNSVQSPYHPRNVGAEAALGRWLLFLDSHVMLMPGSIARIRSRVLHEDIGDSMPRWHLDPAATTCDGTGGDCGHYYPPMSMVHFPVAFKNRQRWYGHYRMTLEKNFWGEWGPEAPAMSGPVKKIAASGIWAFLTRQSDFVDGVGGFNENFRGYGGGEVYLHLKYWRMGGQVLLDPFVRGVHWSAPRSYPSKWAERIRNVGIAGRAVVGPEFAKQFGGGMAVYFNSKGVPHADTAKWLEDGAIDGAKEGAWIEERAKLSFNAVVRKWKEEGVLTA